MWEKGHGLIHGVICNPHALVTSKTLLEIISMVALIVEMMKHHPSTVLVEQMGI